MAKKKISIQQKKSIKKKLKTNISDWDPTQEILQGDLFAKAFFECLKNNDLEGALEMIDIYISTAQDVELIKKANISKSTFYSTLKTGNPTLKTIAKLVSASSNLIGQSNSKLK